MLDCVPLPSTISLNFDPSTLVFLIWNVVAVEVLALSLCSQSVGVVAADMDICIRHPILVVPLMFVRSIEIPRVPLLSNLYGKDSVSFSLLAIAPFVTDTRMGAERGANISALVVLACASVRSMLTVLSAASRPSKASEERTPTPISAPKRSINNLFFTFEIAF